MKFRTFGACLVLAVFAGCDSPVPTPMTLAAPQSTGTLQVGPNTRIASQFHNLPVVEPHLAVHPEKNDHLLVSAMVVTDPTRPYESCRLSSFVSTDGAATWKETAHDYWGYDPWAAILADGHTVLGWIGTERSFQDKYPIVFFTSPDGGVKWNKAVQVLPGNHDGTKLTAFEDRIAFNTVYFKEHMSTDVRLYISEGKGEFRLRGAIDGKGERLGFAEPAILADGSMIVPLSLNLEKAWVQTLGKTDTAFSPPQEITRRLGERKGYFHLVADTGNSKFRDQLYFVRAVGKAGEHNGVFLNVSRDGGKNWSEDRRIDLFDPPPAGRAMVPSVAVNTDGIVGVSWVDSRAGTANDVYFTVSLDGGKSFHRPVRVTESSSDPGTKANDDVANKFPGGGHYLGLGARKDGSFQLVWSDSRHGHFQLQTANIKWLPPPESGQ